MKTKNVIIFLSIAVIISVVVYVVVRNLKRTAQDLIAQTPAGWLGGVRTAEAQDAFKRLMKMKFLTRSWVARANAKYNTAMYKLPKYFTTQQATDVARELLDSNSLVPGGFFDDSARAEAAIFSIQNQVQAAQVTDAYYNYNGKDLNKGLAWLSNDAMVRVAEYLSRLPTGVYLGDHELTELTA